MQNENIKDYLKILIQVQEFLKKLLETICGKQFLGFVNAYSYTKLRKNRYRL